MTTLTPLVLVLTTLLAQGSSATTAADDLATVKDLYASASFEEALTQLANVQSRLSPEQTEQYRALCLLGLGRSDEAQQSLERLVEANPLYEIPESDVPPRLVTMYHDVRKRLLPATTRDLYAKAKTAFDGKQYASASSQFREMLALIGDNDNSNDADLSDLKMLGEGFLKLSDGEVIAAAQAAQEAARAAAAAAAVPATPPPPSIYGIENTDVVPPAEIDRRLPLWNPPTVVARTTEYRGLLEVVIDERGAVESATLRKPVTPAYDPILLDATKHWKFQPATRNGVPVKYRKTFDIVLAPRQ
jgi:tetratricopeptide (TPR) repeat protein